eukprot:s4852_g3.t1
MSFPVESLRFDLASVRCPGLSRSSPRKKVLRPWRRCGSFTMPASGTETLRYKDELDQVKERIGGLLQQLEYQDPRAKQRLQKKVTRRVSRLVNLEPVEADEAPPPETFHDVHEKLEDLLGQLHLEERQHVLSQVVDWFVGHTPAAQKDIAVLERADKECLRRECERAWSALGTEDRMRKKERNTVRQAASGGDVKNRVGFFLQSSRIYRLTLQEEASYTSVVKLVADCCPDVALFLAKGGTCPLKYADDEGDWCTLAQATFDDFMNLQSNKRLLKLRLKSREPEASQEPQQTPEAKPTSAPKEDVPPTGPPPGLENEKDELGEAAYGPGAWGPGGNGGGPRRLLIALHMLREAELLTPAMFASLAVQWLPLVTQRVARKVDKINHMARHGLDHNMKALLEKIQDRTGAQAAQTPGLESYAGLMAEALQGGNGGTGGNGAQRLGEALLELLKALRGLGFEIQTHFCESAPGRIRVAGKSIGKW